MSNRMGRSPAEFMISSIARRCGCTPSPLGGWAAAALTRPAGDEACGAREDWWSQTGSNRRPHACKARALPTELWPPGLRQTGSDRLEPSVVGPGRLELPTLRLSGVRSNQLSYGPMQRPRSMAARSLRTRPLGLAIAPRALSPRTRSGAGVRRGGKRNGDGDVPHLDSIFERTNRT